VSLSSERIAVADRAIRHTVERASVVWRAIPRWDTGDPGQTYVVNDVVTATGSEDPLTCERVGFQSVVRTFRLTLGQATAATPDALLAAVVARAATFATDLDESGLTALGPRRGTAGKAEAAADPLDALMEARAQVEDAGYRAPACLIAGNDLFRKLHGLVDGKSVLPALLAAGNVGELHRSSALTGVPGILIGRGQEIPPGRAGSASPGEEPVDLAVALPPSLEVVGETRANEVECLLRLRCALRVKNERGVVVIHA
jgi:hypothetical protein